VCPGHVPSEALPHSDLPSEALRAGHL